MSFSDRSFMKFFYIVMGFLVTLAVLAIVLANLLGGASKKDEQYFRNLKDDALLMTAGDTLPLNDVIVATASAHADTAGAAEMSGEEVYNTSCAACHTTGAAGAPKLEAAAWEARVAQGFEVLSNHAINGFNNVMPAKGGNASLSDNEVNQAIVYMITEAGYGAAVQADLTVGQEPAAASEAEAASSSETSTNETSADNANNDAAHSSAVAETHTETASADHQVTATESVEAAHPTTESASVTTDTVAQDQDVAKLEETEEAIEETSAEAAAPPASGSDSPLLAVDMGVGQSTYNTACMACHMTGAAGAPKLETAAWESRVAQGDAVLIDHAINGFNAMPAKGGNPTLSDEQVTAAVAYMVDQAGLLH